MVISNELIQGRIQKAVEETIKKYEANSLIVTRWKQPLIGYANATDPVFLEVYNEGLAMHPKEVYRPGRTVIAFFLPVDDDNVSCNLNVGTIPEESEVAYRESVMLSAMVNDAIIKVLVDLGREASLTCTVGDEKNERAWSHRLAAYAAGLGDFQNGKVDIFDQLITKLGGGGRFGSIITELKMEVVER